MADSSRRSTAAVVVVLSAACSVSGCSVAGAALVSLEDGEASICTPSDDEGRAVIGITQVENTSAVDVVVRGIELVEADSLELIGAALRPGDDPDALIVGLPYDRHGPSALSGPLRVGAGEVVTVLLGLGADADGRGTADGVRLMYDDAGVARSVVTTTSLELVPAGTVCW